MFFIRNQGRYFYMEMLEYQEGWFQLHQTLIDLHKCMHI